MWSISCAISKDIHYVNQMMSGGSFVAIFSLRIEPSDALTPYAELLESNEANDRAFPFIADGVSVFAQKRAEQGLPVGKFRVLVSAVEPHNDFKAWRFTLATVHALKEVFSEHEISVQ